MVAMEDVKEVVGDADLKAMVMIGGTSVTHKFGDKIGADTDIPDAPSAARKAKHLVKS